MRANISESNKLFHWPGGNSEVRGGQETNGYRQDRADVDWNVIRVPTACKMPAPTGMATEEDFLTGAYIHQHHGYRGCVFLHSSPAQHATVVGRTSLGTFWSFSPPSIICHLVSPHNRTASHHAQPQSSPTPSLVLRPRDGLFWSNQSRRVILRNGFQ